MHARTLVTGFGAFGQFDINPSALLAQTAGRPHVLLEVAFDAVDAFLSQAAKDRSLHGSFDRLLMLGVAGGASTFRLEQLARNHVGESPDVRGRSLPAGAIEPAGPDVLPTTLWQPAHLAAAGESAVSSDSAGTYLCNYAYYRALRLLPEKRVGFLHVPPLEAIPLDRQREVLAGMLQAIEPPAGLARA
ncbi:MAG TPA: hypothetical protein VER17_04915 [Tepidisphaeraceae bacterium]|nr:hypothetical protein [Tepidisphaeraceae bacterium]